MLRKICRIWISGLLLAAASGAWTLVAFAQEPNTASAPESAPDTAAKIAHWISQLGASEYPTREKAQEELRRLGTIAFDELLSAQDHPDVEIAQRSRYLVRSIPVAWSLDNDPPEVKSLLTNFGELGRNERKTRAQHLATLEQGVGVEPLCRIVRFEPDRVLSKQAALLIMSRATPDDAAKRQQVAEMIRKGVAQSKRNAVEWLLTYSRELTEPNSTLPDWDRITRAELATLAKTPQQSDREVARELLRWQTKLLLNRNRAQEALANFRRTYDLINDEVADIYDAMDWAIENNLLTAPDEIAIRFGNQVRGESRLLYRVAEAQLKRGDPSSAEKTALEARQLHPNKNELHLSIANSLYERGLVDWSANEYRVVIAEEKVKSEPNIETRRLLLESDNSIEARGFLSEMLVDLGRELEAVEVVKPLVEFAEKDEKANEITQLINTQIRGNMHYWYGAHFAKLGDRDKQIEHFSKAIEAFPGNIDILIAMSRLPNPDAKWKQDVQLRIDAHLSKCRSLIGRYEEIIRRQPNFEGAASDALAKAHNELAWLISNTSGDFQEAVRASQRSLELSPNNYAYLDTLGRCYFAAGDLENAVKNQRRAVEAKPHIQVMRRQLKQFEQALADSKANAVPIADPSKPK